MRKHLFLIALICSIFVACDPKPELPTVTTNSVDEITETSARCVGAIVNDGNADITAKGFCFGTEQNPTLENNVVTIEMTREEVADDFFEATLSDLKAATEYYVRAYATNIEGTAYGSEISFTTLEKVEDDNTGDDNTGDDNTGDDNTGDDNTGDDNTGEIIIEMPTVETSFVKSITQTTARVGGNVTADGGAEVISKGFCWSVEQNPTIEDMFTTDGSGVGTFTSTLENLTPNTTYYLRAYATNSEGTAYGEEKSFKTKEDPYNGHEYVDMGFTSGVKWATCNVGSTIPEGSGEYYAWGEIATKEKYESGNCTSYYKDLGDISGKPEYDAASAQWGGKWRTPKLADMYELVTQCTWIWANVNGVNGFNVVSNINGNHIFLPAAGFMNTAAAEASGNEGVLDQGVVGGYWTSTPYSEELSGGKNTNTKACFLDFSSGYYITDWCLRRNGFSIRPVID